MSTTTVCVQPTSTAPSEARRALSGPWPLAAAGAGTASFVVTSCTSRSMTDTETAGGVSAVYAAVEGDGTRTHLAVFAADFSRFLTARAPQGSPAAQVARLGLPPPSRPSPSRRA
jgi:hypothetical protein